MISWVVTRIAPEMLIKIFNDDPELVKLGASCIKIFFAMQFIMGLQMAAQQGFIALGKAKISIFFAMLRKIILLIPLINILPRTVLGVNGIFIAEPVSDTISAVTCFITFMIMLKGLGKDDIAIN